MKSYDWQIRERDELTQTFDRSDLGCQVVGHTLAKIANLQKCTQCKFVVPPVSPEELLETYMERWR